MFAMKITSKNLYIWLDNDINGIEIENPYKGIDLGCKPIAIEMDKKTGDTTEKSNRLGRKGFNYGFRNNKKV